MRNIFALFISLCFISNSFSQNVNVSFSNEFNIAEKTYKNQEVSNSIYTNNHFFTVKTDGIKGKKWLFTKLYDIRFNATLQMFDKDMKLVKELNVSDGDKKFGPMMPLLLLFNNQLFLASFENNDPESFNVYLTKININDLTTGQPKKICTIKQENVGVFKIEALINSGLVYFCASPDNQKLLVACKSEPGKIQTFILDGELNTVNHGLANVGYSSFTIPSAVVTSDNKACIVLKGTEDDETKIICFNSSGKKYDIHYKAGGDMELNNTKVKLSNDVKSIFIYSTNTNIDLRHTWCNGFGIATIDCNSFKVSKPLEYEFSQEFTSMMFKKDAAEKYKKKYYLYNFEPQLLQFEDGKIAIVGSPQGTLSDTYTFTNINGNDESHMHSEEKVGPVVVFFPDKNGKSFNKTIIPRKMSFLRGDDGGMGPIQVIHPSTMPQSSTCFVASAIQNKILIIYNDNRKNLNRTEDAKIKESNFEKDLALAEAVINENGQLEYRKLLSKSPKGRSTYYLENAVPTSTDFVVFPIGKEGTQFKAGKIIYSKWCFVDLN